MRAAPSVFSAALLSPSNSPQRAAELGLPAVALLDRNGVYGAQRFSVACREQGVRPIIGSDLTMEDGTLLPVLVENRTGYKNLCSLLTQAHLRSEKGSCLVRWNELPEFSAGLIALLGSARDSRAPSGDSPDALDDFQAPSTKRSLRRVACAPRNLADRAKLLLEAFGRDRVYVELQRHLVRGEERINRQLIDLAEHHRLPLLATNGVQHATPLGREVLDVFTCIREHTHLDAAGTRLTNNAERHLKNGAEMKALFRDRPDAIANTMRLAERLQFSLENLGYDFPDYPVPDGHSMDSFLRTITLFGAQQRYAAISSAVTAKLNEELALIQKLGFSGYFLIVWDIVNFCRENNIMVQGRGSAANSAVCFCLGITPVDPVSNHLVFERFLSEGRKGWPDIDLDLPSGDRRESVIQEIYRRYGKHGAAMTANVITYRGRSAAREIGKALNFAPNILDRFSHLFAHGDFPHTLDLQSQIEQSGLPKAHPRMPAFVRLYQAIYGLPRHLGQHSGGMIICQDKLSSFVPLENASMPGRVVAQWDKDDCEDLGIVKVDLLGLGMMSVMQDTFELCRERGRPLDLAHIPKDDAATYKMMQKADTIGVFQIESRAQMATLPRMKPKCFYDVVIEVAIIRPGPIQGDMVHPYLNRRAGREAVTYFDPRLKPILEAHARRAALSGANAQDRDDHGRFFRRGSGGTAARAQFSSLGRTDGKSERETARRDGEKWRRAGSDREDHSVDQLVCALRISGVARDQFRDSRLRQRLSEGASRGGVLRQPAEQSADGILCSGHDREGCAPAWHPDAAGLCGGIGMALHGRVG